jgi:hypothetical protein
MSRTREPAMDIDMRLIVAELQAPLHDLRELDDAAVYDPLHYGASQALGIRLRAQGSWGVVYRSVRHAGGVCVGVFRPRALAHARQSRHLALHWDGQRITHWYEKRALHALSGPMLGRA